MHAAGAVKTIIQMLGIEQKRAAAVTMLGKTVERCADTVRPFSLRRQKPPGLDSLSCSTTRAAFSVVLCPSWLQCWHGGILKYSMPLEDTNRAEGGGLYYMQQQMQQCAYQPHFLPAFCRLSSMLHFSLPQFCCSFQSISVSGQG